MKFFNFFFSFKTTITFLFILAIGAGVATFIENDFGTSSARVLVYNNIWYETILVLTTINLIGAIYKYKMWKNKARFIFHFSFIIILIGAGITRYFGYEGILQIPENKTENQMISLEPYLIVNIIYKDKSYYQEYKKEFTSLFQKINNFSYKINFEDKFITINYKDYMFAKKEQATMGLLSLDITYNNETKSVRLPGQRGQQGIARVIDYEDIKVELQYGSKYIKLPFSIKLNKFELKRYPGSMSPSSYASEVTVIKNDGTSYDYRIFMNKTLSEGNFLFFQSSYFPDESGTVLSVNNDPGKWPTYLGYFLLTFGLLLNFFDKKSRFKKLIKFVGSKNLSVCIIIFFWFFNQNIKADDVLKTDNIEETIQYLNKFKNESKITAEKFGHLVVQSSSGRMKPLSSLNREIVQKLTGKDKFFGMNADQIVLGMLTNPDAWKDVKIIKIQTPKLKNFLNADQNSKYISFLDAFGNNGEYLLSEESQKALQTKPIERGTYEKDIIKTDEKLSIVFSVFNGSLLSIFPEVKTENKNDNFKWYSPLEAIQMFKGDNQLAVNSLTVGLINSVIDNKWDEANHYIDLIALYQDKLGNGVKPSEFKINAEILFNKIDIFLKLTLAYLILGLVMLIVAFFVIFKPDFKTKKITTIFFIILATLFLMHNFGMIYRWALSGHAPWSNIYETLVYISWSAIFAGVIFFRKSLLALSSAVIIAGIFMFTAHLTDVDPQITTLVPVLKSYWLTIHVSILTASYGFFGLSAILGFLTLIMFIFRKNRPHLNDIIHNISAINEISLIIGLSSITVGNFLGGVWANESWGRYWGWDPKETWAYVSIIVYAIVIHLRFIKKLNTPFVLSTASLLAFSSILMTYLGVNFYLSGMHSYATGDPVPIPVWAYITFSIVVITIFLASRNRNLKSLF